MKWKSAILGLIVAVSAAVGSGAAETGSRRVLATTRQSPDEFGTQDYGVTVVYAGSFAPARTEPDHPQYYIDTGNLGMNFVSPTNHSFCLLPGELADAYATANIPSGAIIDYIGLETSTPVFAVWGVDLVLVDRNNAQTLIGSVNATVHGWDTDYNVDALGFQLTNNVHNSLAVHVQEAGNDQECAFFGWVEIWWRRQVSPAPDTPSFADVPPTDFGYQYIEALAASGITGGCGGADYCPDAPLTRRQMAIFLAKALGLHWPY